MCSSSIRHNEGTKLFRKHQLTLRFADSNSMALAPDMLGRLICWGTCYVGVPVMLGRLLGLLRLNAREEAEHNAPINVKLLAGGDRAWAGHLK